MFAGMYAFVLIFLEKKFIGSTKYLHVQAGNWEVSCLQKQGTETLRVACTYDEASIRYMIKDPMLRTQDRDTCKKKEKEKCTTQSCL